MAVLIGPDGRPIGCHEARPGCYLAASHYTAAGAAAKYPADYSDMSPEAASWARCYAKTGLRMDDPRLDDGAGI